MLIKDVLYKKGFSRAYLMCLSSDEVDYVMRESKKESAGTIPNHGL